MTESLEILTAVNSRIMRIATLFPLIQSIHSFQYASPTHTSISLDGQRFFKGLPSIGFSCCSATLLCQITNIELSSLHLWELQSPLLEAKQQTGCRGWRLVFWNRYKSKILNWLRVLAVNVAFRSAVSNSYIYPCYSSKHYAGRGNLLPSRKESLFCSPMGKWIQRIQVFNNVSNSLDSSQSLGLYHLLWQWQAYSGFTESLSRIWNSISQWWNSWPLRWLLVLSS